MFVRVPVLWCSAFVLHLFCVRDGRVISRTRHEPYGYVAAGVRPGPSTSQVGFTGHVQDAETELVYMQQRYYDPIAGRFLSVDPLVTTENGGGFSRYTYAANNPYRYLDPDGREEKPVDEDKKKKNEQLSTVVVTGKKSSASAGVLVFPAGTGVGATGGRIAVGANPVGAFITMLLFPSPLGDGTLQGGPLYAKPPSDAKDPEGAKAPGKPGEKEGFVDPKGGEDWVKNPNGHGSGWRDSSGNVWVPTGQGGEAHGGPHWDVQTPGGGHVNVYPGGARR